ncbi:DUF6303 family protein [Streptomyces sp. NBC_00687]|uniref:DUF6303 family protein n=1 Tax=Streptomyces sp. NBC_00687 TaxID=2975807 RepID=UPI00224FA77E|nr:DUF6303 family protein [Streptomyces sp. NBC_00687]MCX4912879.1 DUF6303 family protein [Streptomyces sp. NBC_00687]
MTALRAQMVQPARVGHWRMYVSLGPEMAAGWPRHDWPMGHRSIPTPRERDRALKALGYRRTAEAWQWQEYEGPSRRVRLFASIEVEEDA